MCRRCGLMRRTSDDADEISRQLARGDVNTGYSSNLKHIIRTAPGAGVFFCS